VTAQTSGTKAARHALIAEILAHQAVRSQTELSEVLADRGVTVTQGTLSRDLDELRAQKVRGPGGTQVYALPVEGGGTEPVVAENTEQVTARLQRWCAEVLVTADTTSNQVVLRTPPGAAHVLASALDHALLPGVLGCIAGDDTVLVITRDEHRAAALTERLLELARPGPQRRRGTGPASSAGPPA